MEERGKRREEETIEEMKREQKKGREPLCFL
jgi:hypothetical protein